MYKIHRILLVIFAGLITFSVQGQINTRSPYSRFGIGDLYGNSVGYAQGMGGAGIGMRMKNQMNLTNPASFTAQDTLTFLFDFGLSIGQTNYLGNNGSIKFNNGGLSHIAISFPVFKWWIANIGMTPYSKVGYNIKSEARRSGYISPVDFFYKGSGGLNRYFIGSAFAIKNFSIGVNAYYLLGTLEVNKSYTFWHARDLDQTFNTRSVYEHTVSDMYFGLGAQYSLSLSKDIKGVIGIVYDFENKISTKSNTFISSEYNSNSTTTYFPEDTILYARGVKGNMTLPARLGIGASLIFKNKFTVALDYTQQDWTGNKYPMANIEDVLTKAQTVNFGFQYIPNQNAVRGYFNHINIRTGAYYSKTYMKFNNEDINDYGMSFGLGLPFRNSGSMIHINYELGRRGTRKNDLIQENYQYIFISLTLRDFWFIKSKFD
jgi:hypothetical protein